MQKLVYFPSQLVLGTPQETGQTVYGSLKAKDTAKAQNQQAKDEVKNRHGIEQLANRVCKTRRRSENQGNMREAIMGHY